MKQIRAEEEVMWPELVKKNIFLVKVNIHYNYKKMQRENKYNWTEVEDRNLVGDRSNETKTHFDGIGSKCS